MISPGDPVAADSERTTEHTDQRGGVATGLANGEQIGGVGSASPFNGEAYRMHAANAITAILIHCEAIKRRATSRGCSGAEIISSLEHIVLNARRIWREIDHEDSIVNRGSD